jgi:LacI family transcriptional regulator
VKNEAASLANIRALARQLGLSPTTVSEALRGVKRVAPATAARVRAEAAKSGYRRNPLVGAVMSQVRRSAMRGFEGALAIVDLQETGRPAAAARYHAAIESGARRRAADRGFSLSRFLLGTGGLSCRRLNGVLASRNIGGVLILPVWGEIDLEALEWSRVAGLYVDLLIERPALHSVSTDHYNAIWTAMQELTARGYRRPGLVLRQRQDERIRHRWEGGFSTYCRYDRRIENVPVLVVPEIEEGRFTAWFRRHAPDVVLGHGSHLLQFIHRAGGRVPETTGFVSLNALSCERPCACIDLRPGLLGSVGVDLVVGQILRGERGIPAVPSHTATPTQWVEGPTVRSRRVAP